MMISGTAPFIFTDFEHDVARLPRVQAHLEDVARHALTWEDVRDFCRHHGIGIEDDE